MDVCVIVQTSRAGVYSYLWHIVQPSVSLKSHFHWFYVEVIHQIQQGRGGEGHWKSPGEKYNIKKSERSLLD